MTEEKSPELRATLDSIMVHMKEIEGEIKTLAKQGYLCEKHEKTLVLALYNVGEMIANSVELQMTLEALKKMGRKP